MANLYDRVRYPPGVYVQTHPALIGALATLHGRKVAPFGASRVLEIGCGEGLNLINMALGAPGAEFVGVDLADTAIAAARQMAARTGVANVRFRALDLAAIDEAFGQFDTIVAHGVYAWTPEPVRTALMRVMSERLSPDGLRVRQLQRASRRPLPAGPSRHARFPHGRSSRTPERRWTSRGRFSASRSRLGRIRTPIRR